MNSSGTVHSKDSAIQRRLKELGVPLDALRDAAQFGQREGASCTEYNPPNLKGFLVWARTVRYLRERLVLFGWRSRNDRNYATVVHPEGGWAIAVASGDENTGDANSIPTTSTEKGPLTKEAVTGNQQRAFADVSNFPRPLGSPVRATWLLLTFPNRSERRLQMELSLPSMITDEGFITAWKERIILPPMPLVPDEFLENVNPGATEVPFASPTPFNIVRRSLSKDA